MQTSALQNIPNSDVLINRLPFDIFNLIFLFCIRTISESTFALTISQVCQLWRRFAIDSKALWKGIFFNSKGRGGLTWEGQKQWIQRSGDSPLIVGIVARNQEPQITGIQSIAKVIEPHTHRCSQLVICCPTMVLHDMLDKLQNTPFPILKSLKILAQPEQLGWDGKLFGQSTPSLRLVESSNLHMDYASSTFNTVRAIKLWTQKPQSDEMNVLWINFVYHILATLPELRQLKIEYLGGLQEGFGCVPTFPTPTKILTHHHLQDLWSHTGSVWTVEQILPWVHMSSLQGIWAVAERPGLDSHRWTFSNSSFPIIQKYNPFPSLPQIQIRLHLGSTGRDDLWNTLRCLPELRKLEIEGFVASGLQGIQELGCGWPELVHLVFRASKGVTLRMLREVIEMREEDMELDTLERLDLVSCDVDEDEETAEWLRSLGQVVVDIRESASSSRM